MSSYLADALLAQDDGSAYRYRDSTVITPGSPAAGTVLYGAVEASSFDQLNSVSAISAAGGLKVRRFYEGAWPAAPSSAQQADYARGVIPFVSYSSPSIATVNSGSADSLIGGYFAGITKPTYVTWLHEVDNGKLGGSSIADFKTAIARIHNLKNTHAPDPSKVLFGPLLMGYAFTMAQAPSGAGYYASWLPDPSQMDFVGADPYRFWRPAHSPDTSTPSTFDPKIGGLGTKRAMSYLMSGWETYHAANPTIPLLIGEYSAHPDPADPTDRPNWLQQTHQWFKDNNCIAACYYHSQIGESGPWWLDSFHNFSRPVTFTASSDLVTFGNTNGHGLSVGATVKFTSVSGSIGVTAGTTYYVKTVPSATTLTLSATSGGATLNITANGTGDAGNPADQTHTDNASITTFASLMSDGSS